MLTIHNTDASGPIGKSKIKKVVIDAGHGGKDPGAKGKKSYEKNIVLAIAKKLGQYISENYPDVEVLYTRQTDEFIPLHERADIADRNHADLFISIHANSNPKPSADGTETYVMGLHTSGANLEVAKKENSAITFEEDYSTKYEGYDPNSSESFIIFSLMQNTYLDQSLSFASLVQQQFRNGASRPDRGVKQAGFLVLWKTTMPSVLVETGFISNPVEEEYLNSELGQGHLASSIFKAFKQYKDLIENKSNFQKLINQPDTSISTDTVTNSNGLDSGSFQPVNQAPTNQPPINNVNNPANNYIPDKSPVTFKVQLTSSSKKIPILPKNFKNLKGVEQYLDGHTYKYMVGNKKSYDETVVLCNKVRKYYPDAFVIAIKKGKIISVKDVMNEIKK